LDNNGFEDIEHCVFLTKSLTPKEKLRELLPQNWIKKQSLGESLINQNYNFSNASVLFCIDAVWWTLSPNGYVLMKKQLKTPD
jgi:hypothetical protein